MGRESPLSLYIVALGALVTACQLATVPRPALNAADKEALALIEAGVDLNTPLDRTGATALHRVAADGTPPVAKALIEAGADPNLPASLPEVAKLETRSARLEAASFHGTCTDYYEPTNGKPVVYRGEHHCFREGVGSTLHHAVRNNPEVAMIETLILGGADPDGRGYEATPLHLAVDAGEDATTFIRALIVNGADPNRTTYHVDEYPDGRPDHPYTVGWTPLCAAAGYHVTWREHLSPASLGEDVIQALLDGGADLLVSGSKTQTWDLGPFHHVLNCAAEGIAPPSIVRFLVEAATKAGIADYINRMAGVFHPLCGAALAWSGRTPASALAVIRELLRIGANPNGYGADTIGSIGSSDGQPPVPLVCAQIGRERHASHPDVGLYDEIIEVLIAAGAVWPDGYEP